MHKGNGYNPVEVVTAAIDKTGWPIEQFCTFAGRFVNATHFDPRVAVAAISNAANHQAIPPAVIAFANWVSVKDVKDIKARFH